MTNLTANHLRLELRCNDTLAEQLLEKHNSNTKTGGGTDSHYRYDFSGADLSYANLSCTDLRRVRLAGADLRYANLIGADLRHADLSYALLDSINLSSAVLNGANLDSCSLTSANMCNTAMRGTSFIRSNLSKALITDADMSNSCLLDADLTDANLSHTAMARADLRGAKRHLTTLTATYLIGCRMYVEREHIVRLFRVMTAASSATLNMGTVHECDTIHCLAGWTTKLYGAELESVVGWSTAACLLVPIPEFTTLFYSTNHAALEFRDAVLNGVAVFADKHTQNLYNDHYHNGEQQQ